MKKLLHFFLVTTLSTFTIAQTVLYQDDFETNGTFIMSSTSKNQWTINNIYVGFLLPTVPSQPASFSVPNGKYLHPASFSLQGVDDQANYELPGTQQMIAVMTSSVNLTNYESTEVSFWRTGGLSGLKVIYSIDSGPWLDAYTVSGNPTGWQQETFSLPAADGESDVKIGFEFDESNALDPAPNHYHSIDELSISATLVGGSVDEITASVTDLEYCNGDPIQVDYEVTAGTINAGNEFTLELSDNTGSFASPTVLQSVTSTDLTGTISGTLPTLLPADLGSNFKVRVNSSDDAIIGTANVNNITITEIPSVDFNATTACEGVATNFTDITTGGGTITDWSWDFGNGNTSTNQNPSETYASSGVFNVELTVIDANGCTNTEINTVEVLELPTAQFSATEVCFGNSTSFTDESNAATSSSITNWDWDFDNGTSSTDQNPSINYASPGNYNVDLTVTDANGCADQVTNQVTVLTLPSVSFTVNEVCEGEETVFTNNTSSPSGSPLITFNWDFDDGATSFDQNPTHTYSSAGTYDVTLAVIDDNGCSNSTSNIVTVNFIPDTPTIITNTDGDLEATGTTATEFEWFLNGTIIQGENSAVITPTQSGGYSVIAINEGCVSVISSTLDVDIASISEFENHVFNVYPNPVNDNLQLTYNQGLVSSIEVVDVTGQRVKIISSGITTVDMSEFVTGVYFVKFYGNTISKVLKVVKR